MNVRETYVQRLLPALSAFLQHYAGREINLGADIESAAGISEILNSLPELLMLEDDVPTEAKGFKKPHEYKEQVRKRFPDYGYVVDFANVVKHGKLNGTTRTITHLSQVRTHIANCIYRDDEGTYTGTQKLLWLIRPPHESVDLRRAIVSSAVHWTNKLVSYGFIQPVDPALFSFTEHFSRTEVANQKDIRILGIEGEHLSHQCITLEFDNDAKRLVTLKKGTKVNNDFGIEFENLPSPFRAT